jgi:hypothetical protein
VRTRAGNMSDAAMKTAQWLTDDAQFDVFSHLRRCSEDVFGGEQCLNNPVSSADGRQSVSFSDVLA